MKSQRIAWLVVLLASGAFAQTRTWAFSKDTVRQVFSGPGQDTVRITNSGTDTLRFDSMALELVKPTATHFEVTFRNDTASFTSMPYILINDTGTTTYSISYLQNPVPRLIAVKPQGTVGLWGFKVGRHPLVVTKRAAIEPGDTVVVRMIFLASGGRGRDTVIVVGREDTPIGVQPAIPGVLEKTRSNLHFDPLGRRVDKLPNAGKIPATPLLSPKE